MNGGIQIRIGDFLYAVAKRWKWVLALSFVGLAFGIALNGITYIRGKNMNYEITCSAAVTSRSEAGTFTGNSAYLTPNDFYLAQDMIDAAEYVINSDRVLADAVEQAGLLDVKPQMIREHLEMSRYHETQIMELKLRWNDGEEGLQLMNGILEAAGTALPAALMVGDLAVIDEPDAKYMTSGSEYANLWVLFIAVGFFMGIGIAVLDLIMRPTLLNIHDVEDIFGLETIGTIPEDEWFFRKERNLLLRDGAEHSPAEQNFASSAYILQNLLGSKEKNHCLYVTSTEDGEGKTAAAANLAVQLSDMGKNVLLLDLDMRNPSLGGLFLSAVDYSHSLNALYKGEATPEEAVLSLTGHLDFLPTVLERNAVPMDQVLFDFISGISEKYDYVIIDAPPVGRDSDALSLNRIAHTVLFVVRYDMVTLYEIQKAIEKLDKSGIRILGCIVNGIQSFWDSGFSGGKRKTSASGLQPGSDVKTADGKTDVGEQPEKKKLRKTKKSKKKEAVQSEMIRPRNILEELEQEQLKWHSEPEPQLSDEEAVSALIRMGADGSWKQGGSETKEDHEKSDESENN